MDIQEEAVNAFSEELAARFTVGERGKRRVFEHRLL